MSDITHTCTHPCHVLAIYMTRLWHCRYLINRKWTEFWLVVRYAAWDSLFHSLVQGDCQWPLKKVDIPTGEPTMHCDMRESQTMFRPINHKRMMPAKSPLSQQFFAMSHTSLTAQLPSGQGCASVYAGNSQGAPRPLNPVMHFYDIHLRWVRDGSCPFL